MKNVLKKTIVIYFLLLLLSLLIASIIQFNFQNILEMANQVLLFFILISLPLFGTLFITFYLEEKNRKLIFLMPLFFFIAGVISVIALIIFAKINNGIGFNGDYDLFFLIELAVVAISILSTFISLYLFLIKKKFQEREISFHLKIIYILVILIILLAIYQLVIGRW